MKQYTAVYERESDSGVWLAHIEEAPQTHTYDRTLAKAAERLRESVAVWFDVEPDSFELVERVKVSDVVDPVVAEALERRAEAERTEQEARKALLDAVVALVDGAGLSMRDAAKTLGLSYQRIAQIMEHRRAS